jgi:hypothetical protein
MLTDRLLEEIESGQGETLTRAARRAPRTRQDRPVTLGCLFRWITSGVLDPEGERVYLEAARLAGRWVTTPGAIRRFVEAQTPASNGNRAPSPTSPPPSTSRRRRKAERAARELERAGI